MRKKLLAFNISGIQELGKEFSLNFVCEDNKTLQDKEEELIKPFDNNDNIYLNTLNFIYGKNATGKTTLLKLLSFIEEISSWSFNSTPAFTFNLYNSINKKILLESFYSVDDYIFKQKIFFKLTEDHFSNPELAEDVFPMSIINEQISISKKIHDKIFTKDIIKWFKSEEEWTNNSESLFDSKTDLLKVKERDLLNDLVEKPRFFEVVHKFLFQKTVIDKYNKPNLVTRKELDDLNMEIMEKLLGRVKGFFSLEIPNNRFMVKTLEKNEDYLKFIEVFDPSIEYIEWKKRERLYLVKFKHKRDPIRTRTIHNIISSGTIKGIALFCSIRTAIAHGNDVYIDEVEAHLNNKIVKYIMNIFVDKDINNKGSRLFATTHFTEILNMSNRRDSIILTEREGTGMQKVTKLSHIEEIKKNKIRRKDIKNSSLIKNIWSVELEPGHKEFLSFRDKIKYDGEKY